MGKDSVVEEDLNVANANDPIVEDAMEEKMSSSSEPATAQPTTPIKVLETKEVYDDNESVVGSNTKDETFVSKIVDSIEKSLRDREDEESLFEINQSNMSVSFEKVDGKYKCPSCDKNFKFLTYLKAHRNSKTSCVMTINGRKKRSSMNFSRIQH